MTRFLLIRHAATELLDRRIAGRMTGIHLSSVGRAQAERLARQLATRDIGTIYSSPQARARETAMALRDNIEARIRIADELDEIDYGDWTGRTFEELSGITEWRAFNAVRSCARIPNGEFMPDVQARAIGLMERLCKRHWGLTVTLVSHADVIRSALAHCLGMSLDFSLRLEISPASISTVAMDLYGPRVLCINYHQGAISDHEFF